MVLTLPYPGCVLGPRVSIVCESPILQMAFTHLAYLAGQLFVQPSIQPFPYLQMIQLRPNLLI